MAFKKGISGNIYGRKKGSPNKVTSLQREWVQNLLDKQGPKIENELNSLQGKEYLTAITNLMEFVMPKLQRTELKADIEKHEPIIIDWSGKSNQLT